MMSSSSSSQKVNDDLDNNNNKTFTFHQGGKRKRVNESDVVWKSSPYVIYLQTYSTPTHSHSNINTISAKRYMNTSTTTTTSTCQGEKHEGTTDGEVKVLSQLLVRVRRQHQRARMKSVQSPVKKPPTPKEKRCNALLKKWLTRTPKTRRKRKRSKGSCVLSSNGKTRNKKKKKKKEKNQKNNSSGELLSMLDKVERRLRVLTSSKGAEEEEEEDDDDDDDDDDEFSDQENGDDLHAAVLMESLKILEQWESQSAAVPMSQSMFERRLLEAKSQNPEEEEDDDDDDDENDSFDDLDENLEDDELRWIEHVEETSQKQYEEASQYQSQVQQKQQQQPEDSFDFSDCDNSTLMNACNEMMSQYENIPFLNTKRTTTNEKKRVGIHRFIVQSTIRGHDNRGVFTKLDLSHDSCDPTKITTVRLRNEWADLEIQEGDCLNIIRANSKSEIINIHDGAADTIHEIGDNYYVVLHPDLLLSPSRVSQSFPCLRRGLLSEWLRSGDRSRRTVLGQMKHELFEQCLRSNDFSPEHVLKVCREILSDFKFMTELFAVNETSEGKVLSEMKQDGARMRFWAERHLNSSSDITTSTQQHEKMRLNGNGEIGELVISKVMAVEETVWSPIWGIKGMIDATVVTEFSPTLTQQKRSWVLPLELKTGQHGDVAAVSHRAQVQLYSLLLFDRYGSNDENDNNDNDLLVRDSSYASEAGVLLYTGHNRRRTKQQHDDDGESATSNDDVLYTSVPINTIEIRSLLNQRNVLATYLRKRVPRQHHAVVSEEKKEEEEDKSTKKEEKERDIEDSNMFPPMLRNEFVCKTCYQLESCALYHAAVERGNLESSGFDKKTWNSTVGHLTEEDKAYFTHWENLLNLEAGDISSVRSALWRLPTTRRVRDGTCVRPLMIDKSSSVSDPEYTFLLPVLKCSSTNNKKQRRMCKGDMIVVSHETQSTRKTHFAVGAGTITSVLMNDSGLILGFSVKLWHPLPKQLKDSKTGTWRLDRDEIGGGMRTAKENLIRTFSAHDDKTSKLRDLIVKLDSPVFFKSSVTNMTPWQEPRHSKELETRYQQLNEDQRNAVLRAFCAKDYALIRGMPGTGKTLTVSFLIRALVHSGRTVLVTSYTHSAVDNLLMKLTDLRHRILRIGSARSVHPEMLDRIPESLLSSSHHSSQEKQQGNLSDLANLVSNARIVGATCLGAATSPLLQNQRFDVCIVDEAGQITLPICLGPLRKVNSSFVLIGDENQLPPLVRSEAARHGGLSISLFERLANAHPSTVSQLRFQYRMNEDIMTLSNHLIYNGQLRCGTENVSKRRLTDMNEMKLAELSGGESSREDWLRRAMSSAFPVVFLDMDRVETCSDSFSDKKNDQNNLEGKTEHKVEAQLVSQLVKCSVCCGVNPKDIGVISPYRDQLRAIRRRLEIPGLEISTVDKYQGRDKECIIVSLVRRSKNIGRLLRDWRRVNVAFTRAKTKLIILGSANTLSCDPVFQKFLKLVRERDWVLSLKPGAHNDYESASSLWCEERPTVRRALDSEKKTKKLSIDPKKLCKKGGVLSDILNEI